MRVAAARCLFIGLILAILPTCLNQSAGQRESVPDGEVTVMSIEEVLKAHTEAWMSIPGVVGAGIGKCDGVPCIKVFLGQETPELKEAIPDSVGGYRVEVEVTGPFRALDSGDT